MSLEVLPNTCHLIEVLGPGTTTIYPMAKRNNLPLEAQVALKGEYSAIMLTTHLKGYDGDFNNFYVNVSQSIRADYDCSLSISDGPIMTPESGPDIYTLKIGQNLEPKSEPFLETVRDVIPPFLRISAEVQAGAPEFAVYLTLCR